MHRRRLNIQNFGSGWLRPPAITKTLHQLREEKREQEEHQEAMRREQLAQELAEAEAGNAEEEGMDDVQLDGAQDLDDEIPDADADFALGGSSDDEDDEEEEEEEGEGESDDEVRREERQNDLVAARMRMTDDSYRQAMARGDPDGDDMYGGAEEMAEEDQGHMLDEEDFAGNGSGYLLDDEEGYADMGMDADLDEEVPEAESGMYEHTDSEAEMSSSRAASSDEEQEQEDGDDDEEEEAEPEDVGFAPRTAPMGPPQSPTLMNRARRTTNVSMGRPSMDLSAFLSQDESSSMDSSPIQRRARQG